MNNKTIKIIVEQDINERLDKFLASHIPDMTRSRAQTIIKDGNVHINTKLICDTAHMVKALDDILVNIPPPKPIAIIPREMELDIVYEDNYLAIINKEPGVTTHPGAGNFQDTLVNGLIAYFKNNLSSINGEIRPGIVHRLDKNTSGLIIIAKDDLTHSRLSESMQTRGIKRIYHALVWGTPIKLGNTIQTNFGRNKKDRKKMGVLEFGGKIAITHYKVIETFLNGAFSLIECELGTGRTHQIRVHLSHIGHPLVGDPDYGNARTTRKSKIPIALLAQVNKIQRQMLHAKKLIFTHPITHEPIEHEIDLYNDMKQIILDLKNYDSSKNTD